MNECAECPPGRGSKKLHWLKTRTPIDPSKSRSQKHIQIKISGSHLPQPKRWSGQYMNHGLPAYHPKGAIEIHAEMTKHRMKAGLTSPATISKRHNFKCLGDSRFHHNTNPNTFVFVSLFLSLLPASLAFHLCLRWCMCSLERSTSFNSLAVLAGLILMTLSALQTFWFLTVP